MPRESRYRRSRSRGSSRSSDRSHSSHSNYSHHSRNNTNSSPKYSDSSSDDDDSWYEMSKQSGKSGNKKSDKKKKGPKQKHKECSVEGCTGKAADSGTCKAKHKGYNHCSQEGCTKYAQNGGFCYSHGARQEKKLCSVENCTNKVQQGGFCVRHGAKKQVRKKCSVENCTNQSVKSGVCRRLSCRKTLSSSTPVSNTPRNNNNNTSKVNSKKRAVTKTPATAAGTSSIRNGVGNETPHGAAATKKSALPAFPATTPRGEKKAGSVVVAPIEPKEINESDSDTSDSDDEDDIMAVDKLPKHNWDTIAQTLDARDGYDRITIQLTNDDNKKAGLECFDPNKSQSDDLTVYAVVPGSIAATTEIGEGDIVAPVEIDGIISTAKNTMEWLAYKLDDLPTTIDVYRPSFFRSTGSLNDKKLFTGRLITKMKITPHPLIKTNSLHSSQGKFMDPDGNDSIGACVVISILICERHVAFVDDPNSRNIVDGITNNEIKEILECKNNGAPKYAPLIRDHYNQGTSSDIAFDQAYIYLVDNKIVKGTCRNITQDMSVGNILNRQHVLEHIVEPLYNNGENGRVGIGIFSKGHMITILKGKRYCSFIDTQTSFDLETGTYPDANRVRFNYSSTAIPLLLDYILKKLCTDDNPDAHDREEWVNGDINPDDSRTFWSYVFKPDADEEDDNSEDEKTAAEEIPKRRSKRLKSNDATTDKPSRLLKELFSTSSKRASEATDEEDDDNENERTKRLKSNDESEVGKSGSGRSKRKRSKPILYQDEYGRKEAKEEDDDDEMEPPPPVGKRGSNRRKRKTVSRDEQEDEPPSPELIETIDEIVDEVMSKKNAEEAHAFASAKEAGIELSFLNRKAINARLSSWQGPTSKPVAKWQENGNKIERVRVYPSIGACLRKNIRGCYRMSTHLNKGGYSYGDSLFVWHQKYKGLPRLSEDQMLARLNGTETTIQRLVIDGQTITEDEEYTDVDDCCAKNTTIPKTTFDTFLKKGGQLLEDDEVTYFYRYKFAHPGVPLVLDDETILAKRDKTESTVIKQRLPGVRSEENGRVTYSFETVELGTEEQFSADAIKELWKGGYAVKLGDGYWFISYKHNFKTKYYGKRLISNIMLSDVEKLEKYWALRRSENQGLVHKQSRKESRELGRLVKGTETLLSDIVGDESNWHGSTVSPEDMIRSDEEKEAHELYVKPANTFSQEERKSIGIKKGNTHKDVFYTKSLRQSLRFIQDNKTRYEPHEVIYMYELYEVTGHPSGLTLGGRWRTQGLKGVYKTLKKVPVKRVIKIKLGRYGNVNDLDCQITLIRDDGKMDTKLYEELKIGVKALNKPSNHFIDQRYYDLDGAETEDESIGDEHAFDEQNEQQREQAEQDEQLRIEMKRATADEISATTSKIMAKTKDITPPSEPPYKYKHLELTLSDLDNTLLLLRNETGRKKLRKAFQAVHREWKQNMVGHVYVKYQLRTEAKFMMGLDYDIDFDRRCLSMSFTVDEQNDEEEEPVRATATEQV